MYKECMVLNLLVMCLFINTRGLVQDFHIDKVTYLAVPFNWMLYAMYKGYMIFKMLKSFNPL